MITLRLPWTWALGTWCLFQSYTFLDQVLAAHSSLPDLCLCFPATVQPGPCPILFPYCLPLPIPAPRSLHLPLVSTREQLLFSPVASGQQASGSSSWLSRIAAGREAKHPLPGLLEKGKRTGASSRAEARARSRADQGSSQ